MRATHNPNYREVCSGLTGHNEVVRVVFEPRAVSFDDLLAIFWESHDPTQGMRQGNDVGTQYRSGIYTYGEEQMRLAEASRERFQESLRAAGYGSITTEIVPAPEFYYAEVMHRQNPWLLRSRRHRRELSGGVGSIASQGTDRTTRLFALAALRSVQSMDGRSRNVGERGIV
jgi:methionine-S-sulfoxide reductase